MTDSIKLRVSSGPVVRAKIAPGLVGPQGPQGEQGIPGIPGGSVADADYGDITVSGSGTTWVIDAGAVSYGKIQNISATARFLGRISGGAGSTEELTGTQATTLLNAFVGDSGSGGTKGLVPAPGAGDAAAGKFLKADGTFSVPPGSGGIADGDKGDIVVSGSGAIWTIDSGVVTLAKLANMNTDRLIGRDTAASGIPEEISVGGGIEFTGSLGIQTSAFTGDVTKSAGGTALTIANDAVTYAKLQNVSATARFIGRITAGAGDAEELTGTQATTLLDNFTSALKGLAPASGGGTTNFLRADGTWTTPSATVADGDKGDITVSASGATWTIDNDVVTYAKMQNVSATSRFLGRITAGAGDTEELTGTQATTLLNAFTDALKGLAPASGGGTVNFLRADGTWNVPGGALSDTDRQNFALTAIYQSKLFAGYRRMVNFFASGFKANDSIDFGASDKYEVDTTNGRVEPTTSADTYSTAADPTVNNNSTGWASYTVRTVIKAAATSALSGPQDRVRITLTPATTGNNTNITDCYIGYKGAGALDFDGAQVRVQFSGSNGVTLTAGGSSVVSDIVTLAYDETKDIVVTFAFSASATDLRNNASPGSNYDGGYKSGVNEAATTVASGYTVSGSFYIVDLVEVRTAAGTTNNMTVVTTAQTADASVSTARALIELNPVDAITLNTDLTVDLTCDGGSNWTAATLSSVTVNSQGGRDVAETNAASCTAGTSFQARIKNLNNKNVQVYGATISVS